MRSGGRTGPDPSGASRNAAAAAARRFCLDGGGERGVWGQPVGDAEPDRQAGQRGDAGAVRAGAGGHLRRPDLGAADLSREAKYRPNMRVTLSADENLSYGTVSRIMGLLRKCGVTHLALSVKK